MLAENEHVTERPTALPSRPEAPVGSSAPLELERPRAASFAGASPGQPAPRATPLARRIATAHAIDLARVIVEMPRLLRRDDVLRLLQAAAPEHDTPAPVHPAPPGEEPDAAVLCAMTAMEVDWSAVDAYLARLGRTRRNGTPDRRACLISAAAGALLGHHLVHAAWSEQGILLGRGVTIRIGDDVVEGAADLSPTGVARALGEPKALPAGGDSRPFTIVEHEAALWSEVALPDGSAAVLCVGQARTQLRVVGRDGIVARPVSLLALVYDVRILDQRLADAFLDDVRSRLERMGSLCYY